MVPQAAFSASLKGLPAIISPIKAPINGPTNMANGPNGVLTNMATKPISITPSNGIRFYNKVSADFF